MELDFEKTAELIPISIIEKTLINGVYFTKLIRYNENKDVFNFSLEGIIIALNDYMNCMIKVNNNLSKEAFDRINYINSYYGYNGSFDYNTYLEESKKYIPLDLLMDILNNESTYNIVLNCIYEGKAYNNIPINLLVEAINNISNIDNYLTDIKDIDKKCRDIINFYNIVYKLNTNDKPTYDLNKGLENKIMEKCSPDLNKFGLARSLYLQSCRILTYDINYLIGDDKVREKIYNRSAEDINVNKNRVVCKTWAETFCSLCNKNGIRAIIDGKYHKYVILDCDGIIIKADATNKYKNNDEDFEMADMMRVKIGLRTAGFTPVIENNDFYKKLDNADRIINYQDNKYENDKQELIKEYERLSNIQSIDDDILNRLNIIHDILSGIQGVDIFKDLSAQAYFKKLMNLVLSDEQLNNTKLFLTVRKNASNNFEGSAILRVLSNNGFEYYTYNQNGFSKIPCTILKQMTNLGLIKIIGKHDIFESGETSEFNRTNKRM